MGRYDNGGPNTADRDADRSFLIYWYSSQLNDRGLGSDFLFLFSHAWLTACSSYTPD